MLYARVCLMLGGASDAWDVLQNANKVMLEKASEVHSSEGFMRRAYTVVRFEVMAFHKKSSRQRRLSDPNILEKIAQCRGVAEWSRPGPNGRSVGVPETTARAASEMCQLALRGTQVASRDRRGIQPQREWRGGFASSRSGHVGRLHRAQIDERRRRVTPSWKQELEGLLRAAMDGPPEEVDWTRWKSCYRIIRMRWRTTSS